MEIEAKFRVPNREVHRELLRLRGIAGYTVARVGRVEVVDRYFDTADGRLLAAEYSCRLRTQSSKVLATLKGLGNSADGLHRRDELEVSLPSLLLDPADWPPSDARQLALDLTGGAPLQPLFDLNQSRVKANVMDGSRLVGEWSLDEVRAVVGRRPGFYYELEIELGPDGLDNDLERLAQALSAEHGLEPEPCSKFTRALEILRVRGAAIEGGVTEEERAQLAAYETGTDSELARRAGAVLAWASGLPTREIVTRTGLSSGRVRFWLREFRAKRMGIFAPGAGSDHAGEATAEGVAAPAPRPAPSDAGLATQPAAKRSGQHDEASTAPGRPPASKAKPGQKAKGQGGDGRQAAADRSAAKTTPAAPVQKAEPAQAAPAAASSERAVERKAEAAAKEGLPTVADFSHLHGVRGPQARYVAENALTLFDALRKVHGLPRKRRKLLRTAALLAGVGATQDKEEPERAGRDLILAQPLHAVSTEERLEIACIVALQREKMKPAKEPALEALEPKQRKEAITLACLLQVASALSYNDGLSTRIETAECKGSERCEIKLAGPAAREDVRRANARARYWRDNLKHELSFAALQPEPPETGSEAAPPAKTEASEPPGPIPELPPAEPDQHMAEAGRRVMFPHFMKMLANEAGTRDGEDIEFLHDMRVATRRMRAAYRIFEPFYEKDAVSRFNKELRRAGGALGAVRDLDVLIEKAEAYEASLPPEEGLTLAPLLETWSEEREARRRDLLAYLDGKGYRQLVEGFRTFLLTPGIGAVAIPAGEPIAHQVRHVIPRLIMERYEQVRAYEAVLPDVPVTTYHALRIDCKRLRYALEFFARLLGPGASELIKKVTALQELLGAMQDAHVAEGLVVAFLTEQRSRGGASRNSESLAGVEAYLLTQQQIQADLLGLFDAPWAAVLSLDFRRSLGFALATP